MFFLYSLFPYKSLFVSDNNTLTAWWVLVTLIFCLVSATWLHVRIQKVRKSIKIVSSPLSIERIEKSDLFGTSWRNYTETFLLDQHHLGVSNKTFEDASDYFDGQNTLSKRLNIRHWQSVPGTLVGFGILGTFVGLTFGISSFDIESIDKIKKSIELLLSGMGTAFVSSVWGMFLSMVFGTFEKWEFKRAYTEVDRFCMELNQQFNLSKLEEFQMVQHSQEKMLRAMFVLQTDDGADILPAHIFRDLRREAEQQTKALKSFSTDLADGIRISTETIGIFGNHVAYAMQQALKADFTPALDKIESAVQELRSAKEESSGAVIERIVTDLKNHLENLGEDFHSSLSGTVTSQMADLAKIVGNAGESLGLFPGQLESMMETLNSRMNDTKALLESSGETVHHAMEQCSTELRDVFSGMMQELQNTVSTQQSVIQEVCSRANESTELAMQRVREETGNAADHLKSTIQSLQENMTTLLERQGHNTVSLQNVIASSKDVFEKAQSLANQMSIASRSINDTLESIKNVSSDMTANSGTLNATSENLKTVTQGFLIQSTKLSGTYNQTLEHLESALKEAKTTATDFSTRFTVIQQGLSGIFRQIEEGLNRYQETTRESLNKSLTEFVDHLSQAVTSLHGGIEELADVVDEIAEAKGKLTAVMRK